MFKPRPHQCSFINFLQPRQLFDHLSNLYRDRSHAQSALYLDCKNTRHTRLAPGQCPGLTGQLTGRLLRRVTQTTTTAVPVGFTFSDQVNKIIIKNVNELSRYFCKFKFEHINYLNPNMFFLIKKEDYNVNYY